jgi:hypothetical protein
VKKTMGISWGVGAISTAKWGGVWLRDVMRLAGLDDEETASSLGIKQIHFECVDKPFGVSIPRRKALGAIGNGLPSESPMVVCTSLTQGVENVRTPR